MIQFPTNWDAFVQFLVQASTAGLFLTWLLNHIPLMKNPEFTNWLKFLLAVVVCFIWALLAFVVTNSAFPSSANGWLSVVNSGAAVAFSNQAFYGLIKNWSSLSAFLITLLGKTPKTSKGLSAGG